MICERCLAEIASTNEIDIKKAISVACSYFLVGEKTMLSASRHRIISDPRHLLLKYLHSSGQFTSVFLGRVFNRNHTTVLAAVKNVDSMMTVDMSFRDRYKSFKRHMDYELNK